ncbi:MAG: phenylalanine--tRNA ligase subunit beta, partial [Chitinispirillaceae bacterium]|nr:phenylalanine--tRNA ligase subunit beta [Chitinispirillaceae bacterium]
TIGTELAPDFTIRKSKLRGVESFGMLCSEKELGLSDDHSGLMELPGDWVPGTPISELFPDDAVIEIELTPDRGDCLSYLGVAREIAARFGLQLKETGRKPVENSADPIESAINVTIDAPDRCPRYMGRLIRGVSIQPSPQWLQNRLSLAGIRPINNVVDITNYMLLHFGQPMHAFDYSRIGKHAIIVRTAGSDRTFRTLDNLDRALIADDLVIADGNGPVALAGIMGGAGSEIADTTSDVFLECAYFEPVGVRKTAKRLGLSTDSSYRFERGVDPDGALIASIDTAAALLAELAGGRVAAGTIDVYPEKLVPARIDVHPSKVSSVLGAPFSADQVISYLQGLQIDCSLKNEDTITCTVPLFRHDITIEEDLIEEVGRCFGYDNIPVADSVTLSLNTKLPEVERITDTIRQALAFCGFHEAVTNSMTSEKKIRQVTPETTPVPILNPLNPEMAFMRTTLAGSLLDITAYNCNRKNGNNRFFEIGTVFDHPSEEEYRERTVVALLIEGNIWGPTWNNEPQKVSYYILKGLIEAFATHLGYAGSTFTKPEHAPRYYGNEVAAVTIGGEITGFAGELSGEIREAFEVKTPVCYAELDITGLLRGSLPVKAYTPLPRYPALERDFSFVMEEQLSTAAVTGAIRKLSDLIEEVYPFDVYRGEKLGTGKKSITFSTRFRSPEKTLTDKDVEDLCETIIATVGKEYGAVLRT